MLNSTDFQNKLKLTASVGMQPRLRIFSVPLDQIVYRNNETESSS